MDVPGAGVIKYISTRAILGSILAGVLGIIMGKKMIEIFRKYQIGETIRHLGLPNENTKEGTPTMGGLIFVISTLISTMLFCKYQNPYILLLLFTLITMGILGIVDDYIKVGLKKKEGVSAKTKLLVQFFVGIVVALVMYYNDKITVKVKKYGEGPPKIEEYEHQDIKYVEVVRYKWEETKELLTTIPFTKFNEFDYRALIKWLNLPQDVEDIILIVVYGLIITLIISGVTNAANITDGLDGLCAGVSIISILTLAVFAYVSGNSVLSGYLNIMYIPYSGEVVIFLCILAASCLGFLWYNSYPAQVFMGDTGSLVLGGVIALTAIILRKELLLPLIVLVYFIEIFSVILQVSYFKYTKKRYGEGRRIFLMSPLHHHFQKKNWAEPKITFRFWLIQIVGAALSIIVLKLR